MLQSDFTLALGEAGVLAIAMTPPVMISGWTIQFTQTKRFGGDAITQKSCASGYNNVSGIQVTNGAQGNFVVNILAQDSSGLNPGAYAYTVQRLDSGFQTILVQGYRLMGY